MDSEIKVVLLFEEEERGLANFIADLYFMNLNMYSSVVLLDVQIITIC